MSWRGHNSQEGGSKDRDADPYAIRHNAPVSIVHAAKASLKDPTRPVTPADFGRQLFSRDSEFSQSRPPSAYGMPNSKAFFDNGSKLPIAKLDPYARRSSEAPSPSLATKRPSILEGSLASSLGEQLDSISSPSANSSLRRAHSNREPQASHSAGKGHSPYAEQPPQQQPAHPWGSGGGRSSLTSSSSMQRRHLASQQQQQQQQQLGGMGTAAETVAALKASMAATELGDRMGYEVSGQSEYEAPIQDPTRNDDLPPRPTTSRGRPSSGKAQSSFQAEMASSATAPGRMPAPSTVEGAQVLHVGDAGQLSDSSEDDQAYQHMYSYNPGTTQPQQQQQQQQQGVSRPPIHSASQPASSAPGTEAGAYAPMFGSVVLDDSEEFMRWRAEVDISLRGLASATNALAACSSSSSTASSTASGPAVSAKEAIAQLQQHCGALVELADHLRKQPAASKWLNSSSACIDTTGAFLTIREAIAEHVYRLMDVQNTELLMKACSVVLRVVKSRGPLLQAGKLLYRLSKDSNNDATFRRERLLEPIVRIIQIMVTTAASSTSTSGANLFEPLVYFCGTLKNVTNEPGNQRALVKAGSLHVLSTALSITVAQFQAAGGPSSTSADPSAPPQSHSQLQSNSSTGDRGIGGPLGPSASLLPCNAPSSGPGQVAVQVTGALRNLAVAPAHAPAFLAATCLAALKAALRVLGGQQEVVLNIGRVLSKLSLHEQCQEALEADTEFAPLLLDLLHRYQHHRALLLRIAFALGNLTTLSGAYRKQVASVPGGLDLMISVLHLYASGAESTDQPQETSGPGSARGGEGAGPDAAAAAATAPVLNTKADRLSRAASREDCLVKLLRLIANSAIDTEVGPKLASSPSLCHSLLTLLQHHRYTCGSEEELVLNAVCTLTNVSFYQSHDNKVLALEPTTLLVHITPLLLSDNEEAIVEAARLFGNFSRAPHARAYMADTRVLEALVLLLDHSSTEVLYSVCGTLINFSADVQQWSELMRLGTPSHLLEVLERVMGAECGTELEVATLCVVCKALFNLCSEGMQECGAHPSSPALSQEECSTLVEVLQAVHGCDRLMALPEVPEVTSRLLAQAEQSLGLKS